MMNQVKAGALMSYTSMIINVIIGIVYTPWMIRSIGKSDYGLYTLAMSVIHIFIFDFGLGTAVQRFLSKYIAEGNIVKAENFLSVTFRLYIFLDFLILLLLVVLYANLPSIYQGLSDSEMEKFKIVFAVAGIFSVFSFPFIPVDGILSANEKFIQLKFCDFIHKIFTVITMTICLMLGFGLYALVVVNAISGILTILLKWLAARHFTPVEMNFKYWNKEIMKEILGFSIWVFIIAICQRCVLNVAPSILGMYRSAEEITLFGLSLSIEGYFFMFANALNGLFLPKVSKLIADQQENKIEDLMISVGRIQLFVIGLIYLGLISFGIHFIHVWVGSEFDIIYKCFILMILPSFISLPQTIATTTMVAKNKVRYTAYSSIIKAFSNLILAVPLSKYMGVWGICLSIFISYSLSVLINNILFSKVLRIDIVLFFKSTFGRLLPCLLILMILGFAVNYIFDNETWGMLALKVVLFSVLYVPLMLLFIGNIERSMIIKPLCKVFYRIR